MGAEVTGLALAPDQRARACSTWPASGDRVRLPARRPARPRTRWRRRWPAGPSTSCCTWPPSRSCGPRWRTRSAPSRPTSWARPTCSRRCAAQPALQAVLVVTSDKVYANNETGRAFVEGDNAGRQGPLFGLQGGDRDRRRRATPRATSPTACRWRTARGGNVIGGGDFSRDRLVADIVRAVPRRRGRGPAPSGGDAALAARARLPRRLFRPTPRRWPRDPATPRALNFGPQPGGAEVTRRRARDPAASRRSAARPWRARARSRLARGQAAGHRRHPGARSVLGFESRLDAPQAVALTMDWYRRQAAGEDALDLCLEQIDGYEAPAMMTAHACRFCRAPLTRTFLDLGLTAAGQQLPDAGAAGGRERAGLPAARPGLRRAASWCRPTTRCRAEAIFDADYAYFSSFSPGWLEHCRAATPRR